MTSEPDDRAALLRAEFPSALRGGQVVAYFQPEIELATAGWWRQSCWLAGNTPSAGR
jgi:hypothetical protein